MHYCLEFKIQVVFGIISSIYVNRLDVEVRLMQSIGHM